MFVWNLIPALLIYGLSFLVMSNVDVAVNGLTIFAYVWFTISFYLALKTRQFNSHSKIDFITSTFGTAATIMLVFFVLDKSISNIWNYSSTFELIIFQFLLAQILDLTIGGYFNNKTTENFDQGLEELRKDNKHLQKVFKELDEYYIAEMEELQLKKDHEIEELKLHLKRREVSAA